MGERKGTNKYYPPDYNPNAGGLNKFLGTHALRERARKIHLGVLIIRFEMPYNIWCDGCGNHIGMGVRYNAEKKKVGMYYSTPVYEFRMKCHLCENHFVIVTDPGNLDYVIKSGARRQENRWDPKDNEQVVPEDKATQKRLFDDAMFKLEHGETDRSSASKVNPTMQLLLRRSDSAWKDDFSANSALRAQFRAQKKELKSKEVKDKMLLNKSGLDIGLVAEHEDDISMASLLALRPSLTAVEKQKMDRQKALRLPIISPVKPLTKQDIGISRTSVTSSGIPVNNNIENRNRSTDMVPNRISNHITTNRISSTNATSSISDNSNNNQCANSDSGNSDNKIVVRTAKIVNSAPSDSETLSKKQKLLTLVCTDYNSSSSSNED